MSGSTLVSTSISPAPAFFHSPKSNEPLRDFILSRDGYTYNREDLSARRSASPMINQLLKTAASEWRINSNPAHWQRRAVESPVSLRIMVRPVQLSDGQVYELEEACELIENWGTSPITKAPFAAREELIPNRAVQAMCADYARAFPDAVDEESAELFVTPLPAYDMITLPLGQGALQRLAELQPTQALVTAAPPVRGASRRVVMLALAVSLGSIGLAGGGLLMARNGQPPGTVVLCALVGLYVGGVLGITLGRIALVRDEGLGRGEMV